MGLKFFLDEFCFYFAIVLRDFIASYDSISVFANLNFLHLSFFVGLPQQPESRVHEQLNGEHIVNYKWKSC